ncbi:hypothetical protein [Ferrimonas sp. YFM]|uniref:hypothetical protein n=1 Tax=Ferrimonas sp. YFM TaxID=3028878 RepID=UPI002572DC0C|nr:hypothetical protein [Ferrimonas sp. YFM]BDY05453.1 hypothetical protein F0521_24940 [Ferrimonas sp. YFM]
MIELLLYLNALDVDPTLAQRHQQDPQNAMSEYGLTVDQRQVLLEGNLSEIAKAMGIEDAHLVIRAPQVQQNGPVVPEVETV